jgi:hypothetical protein
VLRAIERKLEGFFEGLFGRAFKAYVQPVELARKLAKEMDERKSASLQRVYAPNDFTVYLSPEDREQFASFEAALCEELAAYLAEHAARERLSLLARPTVRLETDEELPLGTFGIAAELADPARAAGYASPPPVEERPVAAPLPLPVPPPPPDMRPTVPPSPGPPVPRTAVYQRPLAEPVAADESATQLVAADDADADEAAAAAVPLAALAIEAGPGSGRRYEVASRRVMIGRSRECDLVLADSNVSRQHAEVRRVGDGGYAIVDLGSTNGTEVNGRRAAEHRLADGDRIVLGSTTLRFELP